MGRHTRAGWVRERGGEMLRWVTLLTLAVACASGSVKPTLRATPTPAGGMEDGEAYPCKMPGRKPPSFVLGRLPQALRGGVQKITQAEFRHRYGEPPWELMDLDSPNKTMFVDWDTALLTMPPSQLNHTISNFPPPPPQEEIDAHYARRLAERRRRDKTMFPLDELHGMAYHVCQNPNAEVPEGIKPGEAGTVIIGKVFEKHKVRKKIGDYRPDRLLFKLADQLREASGNAQHWILDNLGLLVEKGMPAMIVLCHFPFMSKWVRSEEGDVDANANGDRRSSGAGEPAPAAPSGAPMLG
mmetsp:Transcript_30559/g.76895  ORF Transcript_30559/g.76895 Transcript_30559/m.76895 type:complete len:298 (+) Transcript_30559:3-896(+)